jgi:hypothetical protein
MPNGSTAGGGDTAPAHSPVLVPLQISGGAVLTFHASGVVSNGPPTGVGPDGNPGAILSTVFGPENGIGQIGDVPLNSLLGVFLDDSQPSLTPPPVAINFGGSGGIGFDFHSLSPLLKQPFFIGDGFATGNVIQQFTVPAGATRLYLGTMDGYEWSNNNGAFEVTVTVIPAPAASLLLIAATGSAWRRERRRT